MSDLAKNIVNSYGLERCARCSFCESVCPTYQATRRRIEGPRGRIWLIIYLSSGVKLSEEEYMGLLDCLNCGACDLVCPAGLKIAEAIHDFKSIYLMGVFKKSLNDH